MIQYMYYLYILLGSSESLPFLFWQKLTGPLNRPVHLSCWSIDHWYVAYFSGPGIFHLSGLPIDHKYVAYISGPCGIAQNACMPSPHVLVGQNCFMNFCIYHGWHVRTIICHFVLNLINTIHQTVLLVRRPGVTLLQQCAWPNYLYIHTGMVSRYSLFV